MADHTTITWTDATWNPVTGCTPVSAGCDHCYAHRLAERFRGVNGHPFARGFDVTIRPTRLDQPTRWHRPRRIFVNSMGDLFHPSVSDEFIAQVFAVMTTTPQHTYQLLTKRPERMCELVGGADNSAHRLVKAAIDPEDALALYEARWPLPNLWLGVSVENQEQADLRIPHLLDTPAAVHWISAEPLLGPIDLDRADRFALLDGGLDWIVAGGETGPHARPTHPTWVRGLRNQAADANIPFLFKQWGEWRPGGDPARPVSAILPTGQIDPTGYGPLLPDAVPMTRVGRQAAGRTLDDRLWDQYPTTTPAAVPA